MQIPGLLVVLAVATSAMPLAAQTTGGPWLTATLGAQYLRQTGTTVSTPLGSQRLVESFVHPVAGASVGLPLGAWLIPNASIGVALKPGWPLRTASIGIGFQPEWLLGISAYLGAARIERSEAVLCPAGSSCPGYATDRRWGLEGRVAFDLSRREHVRLGPVFWWSRTFGGGKVYRVIGLGLRVGFR